MNLCSSKLARHHEEIHTLNVIFRVMKLCLEVIAARRVIDTR